MSELSTAQFGEMQALKGLIYIARGLERKVTKTNLHLVSHKVLVKQFSKPGLEKYLIGGFKVKC